MQPVAQTLGELSAFLGRPQEAARHFAAAHAGRPALELTPLGAPGPRPPPASVHRTDDSEGQRPG